MIIHKRSNLSYIIPICLVLLCLMVSVGCSKMPSEDTAATADSRASAGGAAITVDWNDTRQTIVGFGGTMGWIHPHPEVRDEVFDLLFNELGVSVLRIRALGGESDDEECPEPVNDNDDPLAFNWDAFHFAETEAKNAIIIKAARERGVETIIPVTWSPPGWMKSTGRRAGGSVLRKDMVDELAELWTAYVIAMKRDFGIDTTLLSIQNEPDISYYYPTCTYTPKRYAEAMAAVQKRLSDEKLDTQVLGPDTCRIYNLPRYVEAMEEAGVAPGTPLVTHLYDLRIPYGRVDRDEERWLTARKLARKLGRPLWLMETANYLSYGVDPASYEEAFIWAQKIHWALTAGDCEVVCWWALFFDKPNESLIYAERSKTDEYEITPKFYTSMNYYRFVRPDMIRCAAESTDPKLLVSAFKDAGTSRVIVIVNTAAEPLRVDNLSGMNSEYKRYETTEANNCIPRQWNGDSLVLPPFSVTTLVRGGDED